MSNLGQQIDREMLDAMAECLQACAS